VLTSVVIDDNEMSKCIARAERLSEMRENVRCVRIFYNNWKMRVLIIDRSTGVFEKEGEKHKQRIYSSTC
jgi:hypothetical protein